MQNFQFFVVSAVKIHRKCVQTASAPGGKSPRPPTGASSLDHTGDFRASLPQTYSMGCSPQINIAGAVYCCTYFGGRQFVCWFSGWIERVNSFGRRCWRVSNCRSNMHSGRHCSPRSGRHRSPACWQQSRRTTAIHYRLTAPFYCLTLMYTAYQLIENS